MQSRVIVSVLMASMALSLLPGLAAAQASTCNQLGREVALRAAEQLSGVGLDTAARAELASIAETVCMDYTAQAAVMPAADSADGAVGQAAAALESDEPEEAGRRSVFGLELIPPEERVRRPGLKRP